MNNTTKIKILAADDLVEECMTLLICGYTIECFVNYLPYAVTIGETYLAEVTADYSDPLEIEACTKTDTPHKKSEPVSVIICTVYWRGNLLNPS